MTPPVRSRSSTLIPYSFDGLLYGWPDTVGAPIPKVPFPVATNILPYGFAGLLTSPVSAAPPIQRPAPLPFGVRQKTLSCLRVCVFEFTLRENIQPCQGPSSFTEPKEA